MRQLEDVRSNDRSRLKIARKLLLRVTLFVKLRPLAQHLSTMDQTLSLSRIAIKNSKLKSEDTKWRYDKEKRKKKEEKEEEKECLSRSKRESRDFKCSPSRTQIELENLRLCF